ncbi:MAG: hypothetical protein C4527_28745 [Candidatus Omnitrophota bacterium]|nr:MAG: hypothetical protein C4527_28745 [Candidatus Omnitrophota bacterium]
MYEMRDKAMTLFTANNEASILSRLFQVEDGNWSKEPAASILDIRFPAEDIQRMNDLAEKARQGLLDQKEEEELENYRHIGRLLELMKSKARS